MSGSRVWTLYGLDVLDVVRVIQMGRGSNIYWFVYLRNDQDCGTGGHLQLSQAGGLVFKVQLHRTQYICYIKVI